MPTKHRIQFEVDEELYFDLTKRLAHGQLRGVFEKLSQDLCNLLKKEGQKAVGAILCGDIGISYLRGGEEEDGNPK